MQNGKIDPTFVITHRLPLAEASDAYAAFSKEKDQVIKVVLKPGGFDETQRLKGRQQKPRTEEMALA